MEAAETCNLTCHLYPVARFINAGKIRRLGSLRQLPSVDETQYLAPVAQTSLPSLFETRVYVEPHSHPRPLFHHSQEGGKSRQVHCDVEVRCLDLDTQLLSLQLTRFAWPVSLSECGRSRARACMYICACSLCVCVCVCVRAGAII